MDGNGCSIWTHILSYKPLIGALEAGGTKMVCATGYADGTVLNASRS